MLKIHSVVDVITNSSTQIYTQADSGSIKVIKDLVNSFLKFAGDERVADDLFTFELYCEQEHEMLCEHFHEHSEAFRQFDIRRDEMQITECGHDYAYQINDPIKKKRHGDITREFSKLKDQMIMDSMALPTDEQPDWLQEWNYDPYNYDTGGSVEINVSIKDEFRDDDNIKEIAKILGNLEGLFETVEGADW